MMAIMESILLEKSFQNDSVVSSKPTFLDKKMVVVLTAYDDEVPIASAVNEFLCQKNVVKVIVIDNNSGDATAKCAMFAGAKVVREYNQGYGYACIRGLKEALRCGEADIVVLAEGDMTFAGRDIWKLLPYTDDVDMVVGSRTHMSLIEPGSQMDWFYLWGNLFLAKCLQFRYFNLKFLGKTRLTDVGCTLRAIRRESLAKIISDLNIGDHHFSPHMLKVALKKGLKVIEVPVTLRKRVGYSKGAGGNRRLAVKVGLKMLWHIIKE
jgi:glycosyltransferase involved in cell wall biosynthesis